MDPHHFKVDPYPSFHFNADPDPTFHFNVDPDPAPRQSDANLRLLVYRPPRLHADPDSGFHYYNADPDSQTNENLQLCPIPYIAELGVIRKPGRLAKNTRKTHFADLGQNQNEDLSTR